MKAAVRDIRFPDVERGARFDPVNTCQLVEIVAGPSGQPGEELFSAQVCTLAALAELLADRRVLVGRHWLFVARFDSKAVAAFLRRSVESLDAEPTWNRLAEKIGRLGQWEYEDYGGV